MYEQTENLNFIEKKTNYPETSCKNIMDSLKGKINVSIGKKVQKNTFKEGRFPKIPVPIVAIHLTFLYV